MAVNRTGYIVGGIAGAAIAVAALAGAGVRLPPAGAQPANAPAAAPGPAAGAANRPAAGTPQSFADIFERVSPAVVSINVTSRRPAGAIEGFPFQIDPDDQGGEDGAPQGGPNGAPQGGDQGGGARRGPRQLSSGSGFFISPDGYIVTNNHVVEGAEEIKVVLNDERELLATVVGRDESTDLAVIKVEGRNFPYVTFENAATPRVGDWVVAVGSPFGLGGTATAGIISYYGRDIGETFVDYIQIDAPINRGNSGGPTFDVYGRVIGVNTAIFSPSGGSVGIGFAIPADVASAITSQLMSGGRVTRGYVGATIQNLSPEIAESMGMTNQRGAVVAELVPGGPAARAGVQPGDVVVSVNGHAVTSSSEMTREVARARSGDTLHLEIIREGRRRTIDVRSGTRPSEAELAQGLNGQPQVPGVRPGVPAPVTPPAATAPMTLGLALAPLTAQARQQFAIAPPVNGVLIDGVDSDSDAGEKGLRRGDVIVRAGDRTVATPADVTAAVNEWKRQRRTSIALLVHRGGRTLYVPIALEPRADPAVPARPAPAPAPRR
jgi:serine protease Do